MKANPLLSWEPLHHKILPISLTLQSVEFYSQDWTLAAALSCRLYGYYQSLGVFNRLNTVISLRLPQFIATTYLWTSPNSFQAVMVILDTVSRNNTFCRSAFASRHPTSIWQLCNHNIMIGISTNCAFTYCLTNCAAKFSDISIYLQHVGSRRCQTSCGGPHAPTECWHLRVMTSDTNIVNKHLEMLGAGPAENWEILY